MIQAAELIIKEGVIPIAYVFKAAFPDVTYNSMNAKRQLLQMPVFATPIKGAKQNESNLFLMEKFEGFDYSKLSHFSSKSFQELSRRQAITKEEVKSLFTRSERERECIHYAIYKTSGVTPTQARLKTLLLLKTKHYSILLVLKAVQVRIVVMTQTVV